MINELKAAAELASRPVVMIDSWWYNDDSSTVRHAQAARSQPTSARAEALARAPTRNAAARPPLRARPDGRYAETRRFSRYLAMVIGSSSFYFEHMRFSACRAIPCCMQSPGLVNALLAGTIIVDQFTHYGALCPKHP